MEKSNVFITSVSTLTAALVMNRLHVHLEYRPQLVLIDSLVGAPDPLELIPESPEAGLAGG